MMIVVVMIVGVVMMIVLVAVVSFCLTINQSIKISFSRAPHNQSSGHRT